MTFDGNTAPGKSGIAVAVSATFTGHKRVPLWAIATNSLSPRPRFFEDEVELKVLRVATLGATSKAWTRGFGAAPIF